MLVGEFSNAAVRTRRDAVARTHGGRALNQFVYSQAPRRFVTKLIPLVALRCLSLQAYTVSDVSRFSAGMTGLPSTNSRPQKVINFDMPDRDILSNPSSGSAVLLLDPVGRRTIQSID